MSDRVARGHRASLPDFASEMASTEVTSDVAVWRQAEWGDMRVGYETYLSHFDDTELLKGLPDDRCQCPHWGYLLSGQMTVRYSDHEEVIRAGDLYYMAAGHTMAARAGTVLIEFSPKQAFRKLTEIAEQNVARLKKSPPSC